MTSLEGRSAIVTGGSRGIGAAVVERLAGDGAGADVLFSYASNRAAANATITATAGRGWTFWWGVDASDT